MSPTAAAIGIANRSLNYPGINGRVIRIRCSVRHEYRSIRCRRPLVCRYARIALSLSDIQTRTYRLVKPTQDWQGEHASYPLCLETGKNLGGTRCGG
jgi:hypothetical protein